MYSVTIRINGLEYVYALDNKEDIKTLIDQSADFELLKAIGSW